MSVCICVNAARPAAHHSVIGTPARQAVIGHNALQPPSPHMTLSTSCPQHLDSRHLDQSLDSLQLTPMEIDAIRNAGRGGSRASSPSTPTSQLSHPDFEDPRPDIYRFVYDISPGSPSRTPDSASVSAEGGDVRSAEVQEGDSRFDEIVIASMVASRHAAQPHKVKTVATCESEAIAAEHTGSESLPSSHAASDPETHAERTAASSTVQSCDVMVVSVGDALVAVQQAAESVASEAETDTVHQLPVTTTTKQHRESTASRIHKGSYNMMRKKVTSKL